MKKSIIFLPAGVQLGLQVLSSQHVAKPSWPWSIYLCLSDNTDQVVCRFDSHSSRFNSPRWSTVCHCCKICDVWFSLLYKGMNATYSSIHRFNGFAASRFAFYVKVTILIGLNGPGLDRSPAIPCMFTASLFCH